MRLSTLLPLVLQSSGASIVAPTNVTAPSLSAPDGWNITETVYYDVGTWAGGGTITYAVEVRRFADDSVVKSDTGNGSLVISSLGEIGERYYVHVTPTNEAGVGTPATSAVGDTINPPADELDFLILGGAVAYYPLTYDGADHGNDLRDLIGGYTGTAAGTGTTHDASGAHFDGNGYITLPAGLRAALTYQHGAVGYIANIPNAVWSDGVHRSAFNLYNATTKYIQGGRGNAAGYLQILYRLSPTNYAAAYSNTAALHDVDIFIAHRWDNADASGHQLSTVVEDVLTNGTGTVGDWTSGAFGSAAIGANASDSNKFKGVLRGIAFFGSDPGEQYLQDWKTYYHTTAPEFAGGDNWTLPAAAERTPGTGEIWLSALQASNYLNADNLGATDPRQIVRIDAAWANIETAEGVFDWTATDAAVSAVEALDEGAGFHLFPFFDPPPAWAVTAYSLARYPDTNTYLPYSGVCGDPDTPYFAFMEALVARYIDHPRLVMIDARTITNQTNGEWADVQNEFQNDTYYQWARNFIRRWAKAAGHRLWKIPLMISQQNQGKQYRSGDLMAYGYRLGLGERDGLPSRQRTETVYGYVVPYTTAPGFVYYRPIIDPAHALQRGHVFSYSEATENDVDSWAFGDPDDTYLRFYLQLLWSRAVGRNLIAIGRLSARTAFIGMVNWFLTGAGKRPHFAQEAWHQGLTKFSTTAVNHIYTYNYLSEFMKQVDVAGGGTPRQTWEPPENYTADLTSGLAYWTSSFYFYQVTDLANGQDSIYYQLDAEFAEDGEAEWDIYVSYLDDDAVGSFYLEYDTAGGTATTAPVAKTDTDGDLTAVFALTDFLPERDLASSTDFRIVAVDSDLKVKLVRPVKHNAVQHFEKNISYSGGITAENGHYLRASLRTIDTGEYGLGFWSVNVAGASNKGQLAGLVFDGETTAITEPGVNGDETVSETFVENVYHDVGVIKVQDVGTLCFARASGDWALVGILRGDVSGTIYPGIKALSGSPYELESALTFGWLRAHFSRQAGGAELYVENPVAGTEYAAVAHGFVHLDFTTPASGSYSLNFHIRQDDEDGDRYELAFDQTGAVTLQRYLANVADGSSVSMGTISLGASHAYTIEARLLEGSLTFALIDRVTFAHAPIGSEQTATGDIIVNSGVEYSATNVTVSKLFAYRYTSRVYTMLDATMIT